MSTSTCKRSARSFHDFKLGFLLIALTLNKTNLDYPVDGIVIKVNNFIQQKLLSSTSKSPRWTIAYKYPPETAQTEILKIDAHYIFD